MHDILRLITQRTPQVSATTRNGNITQGPVILNMMDGTRSFNKNHTYWGHMATLTHFPKYFLQPTGKCGVL